MKLQLHYKFNYIINMIELNNYVNISKQDCTNLNDLVSKMHKDTHQWILLESKNF